MSGTELYRIARHLGWPLALPLLAILPLATRSLIAEDKPSAEREAKVAAQYTEATVLLRAGKAKEARDLLTPLARDPQLVRSANFGLVLYHHGFASFLLRDHLAAGRSLGRLAPFADPSFGSHARYLLARVHHREDERAEAAAHYEGVLTDFETARKNAAEALKEPAKLQAEEKARLEALANGQPPEHAARAGFFLGLLHYEGGRFPDAQARFADFVARHPKSPFVAEARFYQGCCAVHLRQFQDAIQTFDALAESEPSLAGPALLWLGKAHAASADADDEDGYQPALKRAIAALRQAVDKSAKDRRGEALLELADVLQVASQADEAATIYGRILDQRLLPRRDEEVLQHRVTALHLSGQFDESDQAATTFEKRYPKSLLLPEVLFRRAESAGARGGAALDEAARHYRVVADKYPEFVHAHRARLGLARMHHRKGEWDRARDALERIPQPERSGDLAIVPYLLADCLVRLSPAKADDALAAGRLQDQLGTATALLSDFVAVNPDSPLAANALLQLGSCQQRLADVMAQVEERKKLLDAARSSYERVLVEYPLHELGPAAAFARARCIAKAGDANEAIKRLQAFATGALKKEPVAPLALLFLAELIGAQENKAADAARILTQCRRRYEQGMLHDPVRAGWVPLLQYRHGVALMDAGQHEEARALFDELRRRHPGRAEAIESELCLGQALRDGGGQVVERANQVLATPNLPPADAERASKDAEAGRRMVRDARRYFEERAAQLKGKEQGGDIRARLLYEAIWMHRVVADEEHAAARGKLQEERRAQRQQEVAKLTPQGQQAPTVPPPEVPPAEVPLQAGEQKVRALYQMLLEDFSELPLTNAVRLELGELHAFRGDHAAAVKLFTEALDKEPPAELSDRLRLRLATCQAARGDAKSALAQLDVLSRAPGNPFAAQAHWRAGECLIREGKLDAAIQRLALFRDQEAFQNQGGVSDAALVCLGHALGRLKKSEHSRNAHAQVLSRFPDSPWASEARLGLGWGWQSEKDYAKALEVYAQVPLDQPTETTARARVLIGVCKVALGQHAEAIDTLLAVLANHDAPESCAFALVEAAHASNRLKQPKQAETLLRRVVQSYPKSSWADVAKERLKSPSETPPHELRAALTLLTPDVKQPPPLEMLGQQQSVRSTLDDAVEQTCQSVTLSRNLPDRSGPAPFLRVILPDPFEHHQLIPLRITQAEEHLPGK